MKLRKNVTKTNKQTKMSGQSIRKQANKKSKQNKKHAGKHGNALDHVTWKTPKELKGPCH